MIESTSDYRFHNSDRLGNDFTDKTQRTLQNTRQLDLRLTDYHNEGMHNSHINFATKYPGVMVTGIGHGFGLNGENVESENSLLWNESQRPLEKLSLQTRPFLTVPYLGKGSCDPILESKLLHGETVRGKKSVSTIMENNFMPLNEYPLDDEKKERMQNSNYTVEEIALGGWTRGGRTSRFTEEKYLNLKTKSNNGEF
jgi:hypothetical protein